MQEIVIKYDIFSTVDILLLSIMFALACSSPPLVHGPNSNHCISPEFRGVNHIVRPEKILIFEKKTKSSFWSKFGNFLDFG